MMDRWKSEMEKLTPEMKLLILCSLQDIDHAKKGVIKKLLASSLDWNLFIQVAKKHRVYPIVYKNLNKMPDAEVDKNALLQLKDLHYNNAIMSYTLMGELLIITELMKNEGIRTIPIKGPVLGMAIYGDVTLRPSRDLDILIDLKDLDRAERLLLATGYVKIDEEDEMTKKQRDFAVNKYRHFSYMQGDILIELHWRLDQEYSVFILNDLWPRTEKLIVQGRQVHVLNKEDELLFLALHGSKHGWKRLIWLCDIAEKLRENSIKREVVLRSAEQFKITPRLFQALILAEEIFNIPFPSIFSNSAKNIKLGNKLALMALPMIITTDETPELPGHSKYIYYIKYKFLLFRCLPAKARFIKSHFEPSYLEFKSLRISDKRFYLYYLLRPLMKIKRMADARKDKL